MAERATKKRKGKRGAAEARRREELPSFALGFPEDPELFELTRAFEAGHYARVRAEAPELARRTEDPAVRAAALELARRLRPPPGAVLLLALSALLLAGLSLYYLLLHRH